MPPNRIARETNAPMDFPTILIVDDTSTSLDLVRSVLAAEGFATLAANNGREARALALCRQPDRDISLWLPPSHCPARRNDLRFSPNSKPQK